jgi:predicted signal transduction protein with EAL and GGDEF domain
MPVTVTASIGMANGTAILPDEHVAERRHRALPRESGGQVPVCRLLGSHERGNRRQAPTRTWNSTYRSQLPHQFFLQYQPTISLATGEITSAWRRFCAGGIQPVGCWRQTNSSLHSSRPGSLSQSAAGSSKRPATPLQTWEALGHRITLAVNVSPKQLQRDSIIDDVESALLSSGLDPTLLLLELTETTLMREADVTIYRLLRLRRSGARVAIDDFGTGFSSLAYVQQFPIDVLKIDRSFVAGLVAADKSRAIIQTFVQLGKALDLEVVAEGIESQDQRDQLAALGVDTGQGYFFWPPLDYDDVIPARLIPEPSHST